MLAMFGKSFTGALSVVFASEGFGTAENPGLVPPSMDALKHVKKVDAGTCSAAHVLLNRNRPTVIKVLYLAYVQYRAVRCGWCC